MNQLFTIQVENSAPSQKQPSQSVLWASPLLSNVGVKQIADIGCGRLRNAAIFEKWFSDVTYMDTPFQCSRVSSLFRKKRGVRLIDAPQFWGEKKRYDAVFIICVIHTIPELEKRKTLLRGAYLKLRPKGFLVLDVPHGEDYYRKKCKPDNAFNDGWVMGHEKVRTFYRNYSADELDDLIQASGKYRLYETNSFTHHIQRIWQKK